MNRYLIVQSSKQFRVVDALTGRLFGRFRDRAAARRFIAGLPPMPAATAAKIAQILPMGRAA